MLCYELYDNKSYEKSLLEIESMVKFLESCEFGEVHEQYSNAYIQIVRATNAYVALTLNLDHEKVNFNYCFIKLCVWNVICRLCTYSVNTKLY